MLVGCRRRVGAGLPQRRWASGWSCAGRIGDGAALHPDPDAVARRRPGGLQHHDRRVHRRGPAAAAALAVPGARRAAGQRGRRRGDRPRVRAAARPRLRRGGVDSAEHPWTLDNPAYGWFGLSSAVRVRVGRARSRAVSVAEVVAPTEAESAPLARDLMVALVRAGVTATCSSADKPRYGDLDVDSNLPDARIALGGPDENAFTAAVLAAADPAYTAELQRQLVATGAGPGVGAGRGAAGRRLGARRRPARRAGAAGARRRRTATARRRGRRGRRRPRRRRDRRSTRTRRRSCERLRAAHRRGAQPRRARLRRRHRRHPAHAR